MNKEIYKKLQHKVKEHTHTTLINHIEETDSGYIVQSELYTLLFDDEFNLLDISFGCKNCF